MTNSESDWMAGKQQKYRGWPQTWVLRSFKEDITLEFNSRRELNAYAKENNITFRKV